MAPARPIPEKDQEAETPAEAKHEDKVAFLQRRIDELGAELKKERVKRSATLLMCETKAQSDLAKSKNDLDMANSEVAALQKLP